MLVPKTALLQVRIEPELLERFQVAADYHRMSMSAVARQLIMTACDSFDSKLRHMEQQQAKVRR